MLCSLIFLISIVARKLTPRNLMSKERTFIAVKPDGVQRGLIGDIIKRFEAKGFKLTGMKFMQASEEHLQKHYADLSHLPFFPGLVKYMASGPLVAMCWEGTGIVKTARQMMGETKPADSKPGTIRGDFCIEVGRNIIHGSDSVESAEKEINLWFKPEELVSWTQATHDWIYELLTEFGDINTKQGLWMLNTYLQDRSYIQGCTLSRSDLVIFSNIIIPLQSDVYPHLRRWHMHIRSVCVELGLNVGSYEFSKIDKMPRIDQHKNISRERKMLERESSTVEHSTKHVQSKERRNNEVKDNDAHITKEFYPNIYAVLLEVKPKDVETDFNVLEDFVRGVTIDGLKWGASQLSHVAYGRKKLSIICTLQDDKTSIQDVLQKLSNFECYVDIAGFSKL